MWDNAIGDIIGKGNRRLLQFNVGIILVSTFVLLLLFRTAVNEALGPKAMTALELQAMAEPQNQFRNYIGIERAELTAPVIIDWRRGSSSKNGDDDKEIKAVFQFLKLGDKVLLVRSKKLVNNHTNLDGFLGPLREVDRLYALQRGRELFHVNLSDDLMPATLDAEKFDFGSSSVFFTAALAVFIVALRNLKLYLDRRRDFSAHPISRALARYGEPLEVAKTIAAEMGDLSSSVTVRYLTVTDNWVVYTTPWGAVIKPLKELVWAYRQEVPRKVWFVAVDSEFSLIMHFSDMGEIAAVGPLKENEKLLAILAKRAPWAFYGFSEKRKERWKKAPQAMCAEVRERKENDILPDGEKVEESSLSEVLGGIDNIIGNIGGDS